MPIDRQRRLAIVLTHPIQYHSPWFRNISSCLQLKVFYLWNPAATNLHDPGFGQNVEWDVPLLKGYDYEFVPNTSRQPGSARFRGIDNPELLRRLDSFRPDAALLIGYRYKSMLRLIFSPRRTFPLLFRGDSHRLGQSTKWKVEIRKWGIGRIFKRFAAFLYVGKANRDYFQMHGVPEEKLFFAPHAVDNERFQLTSEVRGQAQEWRRELGVPGDKLLVMFAGKFEPKKRPLDLLEAFSRSKFNNAVLIFVGSGELEVELRRRASPVDNVLVAPFQNQSKMPRTYAACDIFVLPSYGGGETWGLAVNEAMAMSRSIVLSDHVGCWRDLVHPNTNGLVFNAGNVSELTDSLRIALQDPERLQKWGQASRAIIENYSYKSATNGLQDALEAVIRQKA